MGLPRLNLHGRALFLIIGELFANATLWIVAGLLFGIHDDTKPLLGLALLSWVFFFHGLVHCGV
ncbi:hypothetical protein DL96DRAFT_1612534, partial [Flagelloscypha sp. PMI_526]